MSQLSQLDLPMDAPPLPDEATMRRRGMQVQRNPAARGFAPPTPPAQGIGEGAPPAGYLAGTPTVGPVLTPMEQHNIAIRQPNSDFGRDQLGFEADQQNPIIQALGGPMRGQPGVIPSMDQYNAAHPRSERYKVNAKLITQGPLAGHWGGDVGVEDVGGSLSPAQYAELMRAGSQTGANLADTALRRTALLGAPGVAGSMQRENDLARSSVEANGMQRLLETQRGARYNAHMSDPSNGRTAAERQRSWDALNIASPQFINGGNVPATGEAGSQTMPMADGGVPANAPPVPRRVTPPPTPEATLSGIHDEIARRVAGEDQHGKPLPIPEGKIDDAISEFVSTAGRDLIRGNHQAFSNELIRHFGAPAVDRWYTATDMRNSNSSGAKARRMLREAQNSIMPGVVSTGTGPVNQETQGWPGGIRRLLKND